MTNVSDLANTAYQSCGLCSVQYKPIRLQHEDTSRSAYVWLIAMSHTLGTIEPAAKATALLSMIRSSLPLRFVLFRRFFVPATTRESGGRLKGS